MMILTVEEIMVLHSKLTARTGGSDGIRDRGLLESAVYSADMTFGGFEAYPTIIEKAARLMYALVNNHAFVDGNKRIGILAMLVTLRLNNVKLVFTQAELIDFGLSAADGSLEYDDILDWINKHLEKGVEDR